jgi:NAD(P)H-hydrate repair Nnr-like enzyme with NAD(P)H-hydrate dehydratase domain
MDAGAFVQRAVGSIGHWLERFDVVVVGPGLGRDCVVHDIVVKVPPLLVPCSHCILVQEV